MRFINKLHIRGDTMVEVMLSMAVIGMVIGGAYTISNKSTQLGRLAQQRTQVNNLMRSQAELVKLFRDGNSLQWTDHTKGIASYAQDANPTHKVSCTDKISNYTPNSQPFYVETSDSNNPVVKYTEANPSTTSKPGVDPTGQYQIFVVPYSKTGSGYTDFYIIGCWQGPGSYGEQQSFIVERLNNPS